MSAAGTPSNDPWVVLTREKVRYEEQFSSLEPNNGVVTGDQVKSFLLQSQLPPLVLGQIWTLADTDADGKMDLYEFSIACKLINLKLRGFDVPKALPTSLLESMRANSPPVIPPLPNLLLMSYNRTEAQNGVLPQSHPSLQPQLQNVCKVNPPTISRVPSIIPPIQSAIPTGVVPPMQNNLNTAGKVEKQPSFNQVMPSKLGTAPVIVSSMPPLGIVVPIIPGTTVLPSLPASITSSVETEASDNARVGAEATNTAKSKTTILERPLSTESPLIEWSVPHQTKLKYTQIFNTTDKTRSGFLSGPQARNVMVQTKLPQHILAQIWGLSDMDADGRLGCEEFVLAMHLCEQASLGQPIPTKLPPDLIPPTFRRLSRIASISSQGSAPSDTDPVSSLLQTSFEDKRKENFEKGQAELERRRKAILDQQRKEAEERERKEREDIERRERARQETERKRIEELERQMRVQQEDERLKEGERRRQTEQRESARREMERQRDVEWENQRLKELQQQRQREQENVLRLKAKTQSLTIELSTLNEQVKQLSQNICDTRLGVSNVKQTIDGMRFTRDNQMQEMSQFKNQIKEQNTKLLLISQEKVKLDAKNKLQMKEQDIEIKRITFDNKDITIKNLKEKIEDMQMQVERKSFDIENNNTYLTELRMELNKLVHECEELYSVYDEKRSKVLELKDSNMKVTYQTNWVKKDKWDNDSIQDPSQWPSDDWSTTNTEERITASLVENELDFTSFRALYEFMARNSDELTFQPGDVINVPKKQTGEAGWLAGELHGHTGWFPESYVEPVDGIGVRDIEVAMPYAEDTENPRLEGIAEVPEATEGPLFITEQKSLESEYEDIAVEFYIANYPYLSQEQGDLTFNAGDVIAVIKKDGDWWTGTIGSNSGIFPSNYVQKVDVSSGTNSSHPVYIPHMPNTAVENANIQVDVEVSQINENKVETPLDASMTANAQIMKGKKPEIASVIAPYQATSLEQLSLARGQLIMIRKKTDSGWWEGELQAKGKKRQVGWFPASYVKVLNSSGRISGRTTPVSSTRLQQEIVIDKVVTLFPYTAGNPDELSFTKDEIISVTARVEEAWWRGEINGVSGLFPSNYVTPLQ